MKCLERNKIDFYYALYNGRKRALDDDGKPTGEWYTDYKTPRPIRASVSAARGDTSIEQFGAAVDYDRVIVTDDMNCPIDEHSVICLDVPVSYSGEQLIYDYIVRRVAKSLNSVSIAISRVNVS